MVDATPITKKKKGSKGLPKGITEHQSKKLQARLSYKGEDGKTIQRFIPGLFEDIDAAVAAQAAASKVLDNDGPLAVWPPVTKPERKKRGEGPARLPGGTTGKKWNRGAPLSHKAKTKSDSHVEPTAAEQQGPLVQPKQLTTVPLPCAIEDINNSEMQAFFASGNA